MVWLHNRADSDRVKAGLKNVAIKMFFSLRSAHKETIEERIKCQEWVLSSNNNNQPTVNAIVYQPIDSLVSNKLTNHAPNAPQNHSNVGIIEWRACARIITWSLFFSTRLLSHWSRASVVVAFCASFHLELSEFDVTASNNSIAVGICMLARLVFRGRLNAISLVRRNMCKQA